MFQIGFEDLFSPHFSAAWGNTFICNNDATSKYFMFGPFMIDDKFLGVWNEFLIWKHDDDKKRGRLGKSEDPRKIHRVEQYSFHWAHKNVIPVCFRGENYTPHLTHSQYQYLQEMRGPQLHFHELKPGWGYYIPAGLPHCTLNVGNPVSGAFDNDTGEMSKFYGWNVCFGDKADYKSRTWKWDIHN